MYKITIIEYLSKNGPYIEKIKERNSIQECLDYLKNYIWVSNKNHVKVSITNET